MKKKGSELIIALFICSSMSYAQNSESILKQHIRNTFSSYKRSDLSEYTIDNKDYSKSLNGEVIKIQQTYKGLPIYNAVSTALIKDNKIAYFSDAFEKDYKQADQNIPKLSSSQAFEKVSEELKLKNSSDYTILQFHENDADKYKLITNQRLVYLKHNESLILCYEFLVPTKDKSDTWDILISAENGKILHKLSLMSYCNVSSDTYKPGNTFLQFPQNKNYYNSTSIFPSSYSMSPDNASYNVFALPVEAPNFGPRTHISNPWILSSSPEGWHSDGTDHYTNTQGNNIIAFATNEALNKFAFAEGGSTRNFNFLFDDNASTDANMNAAVANAFYTTNMVHDILYKFGFTEIARNFQINNFGLGGAQNDPVLCLVMPIVTNTSSFVNYPDGKSGEIGLQLWSEPHYLYYQAPSSTMNRRARTRKAPFGNQLDATGVSGNVLIPNEVDGCTSLPIGSLNNAIGLIKAGNCTDAVKVKNAQNAGAVAVVIYQASDNEEITRMTGTDSTITIPSVKVLNSEGEYIKNLLNSTAIVNITLKNDPALEKEKSLGFDNGVVIHEYVHGLSNRLTGTGYSCLDPNISAEQMGEGWSDFYAMMLTNKPEYTEATARGIGTYLAGEPVTGIGVRPAKYSTNFSINNFTYGKTNGMQVKDRLGNLVPDIHNIGFIWTTMLWDLHWKYAEKYGYSADLLANTTNGSTKVLQLITDALKLQTCNPTFVDGRNAILAAELDTTGGENKCLIWEVFAKRGLGVNASAGDKTNINDQVEDFTVPTECNTLGTTEVKAIKNTITIYPNPAQNEFNIIFPTHTMGKVNLEIYDMSGKLVTSENKISTDNKKTISTEKLVNGTYLVKVKGINIDSTSKIIVKK
ncbi:T9SS C-terminal target domain-containing protein [Chryseobacterium nematophagum]|uniref:T9SS C-terminal target domain-containing protein n=1 Tax=Chryseobacterium nematophagum TaxID=2305228 RepID=A0A3M7LCC8_9FLAO|nr:T9SS-dependent M36 family metallopeptidase [Chryseobacterium nematophagum]RMZ59735.1 T9SS C-terminal target domain-containing protein [Chryseobacterium nematophagum]